MNDPFIPLYNKKLNLMYSLFTFYIIITFNKGPKPCWLISAEPSIRDGLNSVSAHPYHVHPSDVNPRDGSYLKSAQGKTHVDRWGSTYGHCWVLSIAAAIVAEASSSVRFFFTLLKASIRSPTAQSLKSSIPMPHSSPAFTYPEENSCNTRKA